MMAAASTRRVALRLDDVGASSKRYEVYSKRAWQWGPVRVSGNWLFLKYLPGLKSGGPYREMRADEWRQVLDILANASARMTVAITAAWADSADRVTPFPVQFPSQAEVLRDGVRRGLLEVANHGLTHCVLEGNVFHPHWMSSNRAYHREFWDWVPPAIHEDHIRRSQEILQEFFGVPVITFVPPGNVFTDETLAIAGRYGLRFVSCQTPPRRIGNVTVLGNEDVIAFHDRDLVVHGVDWLRAVIDGQGESRCCAIADLAPDRGVDFKETGTLC